MNLMVAIQTFYSLAITAYTCGHTHNGGSMSQIMYNFCLLDCKSNFSQNVFGIIASGI